MDMLLNIQGTLACNILIAVMLCHIMVLVVSTGSAFRR